MKQQTEKPGREQDQALQELNRGAKLLEGGNAEEAIPHLERAYELDAASVPILITLGGAYIVAGRHRKAVPLLEAARDAEPDNTMVWINLGAAYLGNPILATNEQQMQAIQAFEKALELNPVAPSVHYNLGLIFVDRGESDLALAAFRQAVKANPMDRDARIWIRRLEGAEKE
jgi:tetratricopeptide (TPR) repeat protein